MSVAAAAKLSLFSFVTYCDIPNAIPHIVDMWFKTQKCRLTTFETKSRQKPVAKSGQRLPLKGHSAAGIANAGSSLALAAPAPALGLALSIANMGCSIAWSLCACFLPHIGRQQYSKFKYVRRKDITNQITSHGGLINAAQNCRYETPKKTRLYFRTFTRHETTPDQEPRPD